MQNKYAEDIGNFIKFALLRALAPKEALEHPHPTKIFDRGAGTRSTHRSLPIYLPANALATVIIASVSRWQ